MEQKRVSFKVAKAIKEAGYPQDETEYKYTKEGNIFVPRNRGEDEKYSECDAPYVTSVWLWLWREKKINIDISKAWDTEVRSWVGEGRDARMFTRHDPEEVIIIAIDYLVENNLIK